MNSFKLDRTAFKGPTLNEAANHAEHYKKLTWQERLEITAYLNSVAYKFDMNHPPKIDRTKFSAKSFKS